MDEFDIKDSDKRMKELDREEPVRATLAHIMRGGSIYSRANALRASDFSSFLPAHRNGNTGFRVARTIETFESSP
jgi:formylglycine-generating enzyme required for sulfatase activity